VLFGLGRGGRTIVRHFLGPHAGACFSASVARPLLGLRSSSAPAPRAAPGARPCAALCYEHLLAVTGLFDKKLILVAGKGGVGRSTVAAAIAAAAARRGRRTLLYEADATDRFGRLFGGPVVGREPVRLRANLDAINTDPEAAIHEYGVMVLKFERVYRMVFENRVSKTFLRAIPGLDDYAVLGKAWYHTTEEHAGRARWDTVVFDMPASGHAVSMLRVPSVILDTVPDGPLTRDARRVRELLIDPARTSLVLVTLAEEMPANEARQFAPIFRDDLRLPLTHVVTNQVFPDHVAPGSAASRVVDALAAAGGRGGLPGDLAALAAHGDLGRSRRALNERYLVDIDALARASGATHVQLPLLFVPALGPPEIDELSARLEAGAAAS
jgi:anion-transporting  ArsA/GET3 family ATPase